MSKEMFSVLGELDHISMEIDSALDALGVYASDMEDDLESIVPDKEYSVKIALENCELNASVLRLARQQLNVCLQNMTAAIDKGYTVARSADPAAK